MFTFATSLLAQIDAETSRLWIHIGLAALVVGTVLIILWRMSRIILTLLALGVVAYVGYTWCYERTEPRFMSPIIDVIAPHLPAIGEKTKPSNLIRPQTDPLPGTLPSPEIQIKFAVPSERPAPAAQQATAP